MHRGFIPDEDDKQDLVCYVPKKKKASKDIRDKRTAREEELKRIKEVQQQITKDRKNQLRQGAKQKKSQAKAEKKKRLHILEQRQLSNEGREAIGDLSRDNLSFVQAHQRKSPGFKAGDIAIELNKQVAASEAYELKQREFRKIDELVEEFEEEDERTRILADAVALKESAIHFIILKRVVVRVDVTSTTVHLPLGR